jgi:outer membrane receptor protein involved in Fe transport
MNDGVKGRSGTSRTGGALRASISAILRQRYGAYMLGPAGGLLLGTLGAHAQSVAPSTAPPAAPAPQGIAADPAPQGSAADSPSQGIAEIVVTAQRRRQSIQDIPYNISAVDASTLAQAGATSLNDLTRVVSGLVTVDEGPGARGLTNNLTLRGLRTDSPGGGQLAAEQPGQTVNSVSTYFGETPVFFPIPLYDIDRVEVLRGPQGTLYGSGAQAGTIRFIPNRPKFDEFSGEVEVTGSGIENAFNLDNLNKDVKGVLNLPLADHLALRIVAGDEHDAGFIDNDDLVARQGTGMTAVPIPKIPGNLSSGPVIAPEQRNTNTTDQYFTRLALRWQPIQALDMQVDYLHQYINSANAQLSNPLYRGGPLDLTTPVAVAPSATNQPHYPNSTFIMNPGGTYMSTQFELTPEQSMTNLVSAVETADLGLATFTSATSFYSIGSTGVTDWTPQIDNPAVVNYNLYPPYNFYPRIITVASVPANEHAFIQELRLASEGDNHLDYVVGAYYQREVDENGWNQFMPGIAAYNTSIGQPNPSTHGDDVWDYRREALFQDRAIFGELTWHITPAWQATGGVRFFDQTFSVNSTSYFYLCGATCAGNGTNPEGQNQIANSTSFARHVWKWNTSYDISPQLKLYATYSEGFRRGGANALPEEGAFASLAKYSTYAPDLAKNYEIGIKGSLLDRKIVYSADIYRINLSNFQFNAVDLSGLAATYNGNTARSQGVEFDLQLQLTHDTSATVGYAYTDAKVTQTVSLYDLPSYALLPSLGGNGQTVPLFGGPVLAGSRLPGVPENTFTFGIDHTLPLTIGSLGKSLTLHMDGAYRSPETGDIQSSSPYNWNIPWSFVGNARATIDSGNHFSYSVFVDNFTDDPGYSGGNNDQAIPNYSMARVVMRPRTYGISLKYGF